MSLWQPRFPCLVKAQDEHVGCVGKAGFTWMDKHQRMYKDGAEILCRLAWSCLLLLLVLLLSLWFTLSLL